ncbi:MAG: S46 family peptidase, partial [Planctomycetaceae bacterium]
PEEIGMNGCVHSNRHGYPGRMGAVMCRVSVSILLLAFGYVTRPAVADEGMWLFTNLPMELLSKRHGFEPTAAWAERLRLASVRFNNGGSGSFVSVDGLVLTNHHVASDTLSKLSSAKRDILTEGYLATSHDEELRAPYLELNRLEAIVDVTEEVKEAVTVDMSPEAALQARRSRIASIEDREKKATGLRCDVVPLYGGNVYHLYRSRRFTDVRLVWAPERSIAFFGGDADNFEFPRYDLDACLFRVWEDGKPARIPQHLAWSRTGVAEGDLVFVSGHPGRTQRLLSSDALREIRDHQLPGQLDQLRRREVLLQQFSLAGPEAVRRARSILFGTQNARKARLGGLSALQTPGILEEKVIDESPLKASIAADPSLRPLLAAWDAAAVNARDRSELEAGGFAIASRLFGIAHAIVQLVEEDEKPSGERLPEYADAGRESLLLGLYSEAPLYEDLETALLADSIGLMLERRGAADPLCVRVLDGLGPLDRAAAIVAATRLTEVAERRRLVEGGREAIAVSDDSMIRLARLMDAELRRVRRLSDELAERDRQAADAMMRGRFSVRGTSEYPDATFTLRLAYGTVMGYREEGRTVTAFTTIGGAFDHEESHSSSQGPQQDFALDAKWHAARERLDPTTPLNFVCTADIIGGNSGSPVVNRKGELVGLIFDGNIQSLSASYVYSDLQSRAVAVDVRGVLESLRVVYGAEKLVAELLAEVAP